jgi:hypothetical protein
MKKTLITTLLLAASLPAFSQGFLTWGNNPTGFRAPIYGPAPGATTLSVSGQSSLGTPSGATVYSGPLLSGTGYTFAIYAGPAAAADSSALTLLVSTTFRTGTGALPNGLVNGGTVTVPGVAPGNPAKFQIRVWDLSTGATYDAAAIRGASPVITSAALGGIDTAGNIVSTPATTGWTSFNIYAVPEPSTFVLAGLGAASLLIFRRRK